jgi:hypothetical protein
MSPAGHFVRHHKFRTDHAIGRAYARLATDTVASAAFAELLSCARRRAPLLLAAPCTATSHPSIEALLNLARWSHAFLRALEDWPGSRGSWRVALDSLVQHLLAKYPLPRFLTSAWLLPESAEAERQRRWVVTHAGGCRFRSMDVPIKMTRRMEHIFLKSSDHLDIHVAMRRAELVALQIPEDVVATILSTQLATDLRCGDFWRTVWHFIRANIDEIVLSQVAPMIDFVYSIRQERIVMLTPDGMRYCEPPHANFSMKGRTAGSLLRLMEEWHNGLRSGGGGLTWGRSTLRPMVAKAPAADYSEAPALWQFVELTSGEQLRAEGRILRHCVASYASRCWRGARQIWSLRLVRADKARAVVTLEIDPGKRAIVQARGFRNRYPSGRSLQLIRLWADREGLCLSI